MAKGSFARDQLRAVVDRIEALEIKKGEIAGDIKEVYAEAKGNGFDTQAIRFAVKERKISRAEREERDAVRDLYMSALGELADTPLGRSAAQREGIAA